MWGNEGKDNHTHESEEYVKESSLHRESDFNLVWEIVLPLAAFFGVGFEREERERWQK